MKSFSKRVASFAMAAAMVLSVAAVSPVDAEAATAKITKKSSITAGKTYTYNVKNVTKSQYIKVRMSSGVTVKYNNKTVKKASTKIKGGKTIALKVKAADKVGNYKATLKAVIYNKKNNKKVKTLTTQSTVKCTTLKVTSVQTASTTGKYLVATFNKSLDSLNPADIEIRNLNTNELKGVEDVKLASNGKSATITLAGSEYSGTSTNIKNDFVEPNVDYSFTVNKNGATATTRFTVDAVAAYVTVVNYNVDTRELELTDPLSKNANIDVNTNYAWTVKVPETVCTDNFQSLLGRTVSVWYNKNDVATKLQKAEETVVEGAFEYISRDTATPYLKDKVTGKQYYISRWIGNTSDVHDSHVIWHDNNGYHWNFVDAVSKTRFDDKEDIDYAKLVLYSNGKIRTMFTEREYKDELYVTDVNADKEYVFCGKKKSVNLKGFTIISNDKKISIKDIKVGDMLFVDDTNKFAEVYTSTKDGKVEAAYDAEFKFEGTLYKNIDVQLLKEGKADAPKTMEIADANAFIAAGGAATVYLDHANEPVFIKGEQKYAATESSVTLLATTDLVGYELATRRYVQFKGFDGTSVSAYDICLDNLKSITVSGNTFDKNLAFDFAQSNKSSNITGTGTKGNAKIDTGIHNSMVELQKDASGNIIGVTIKEYVTPDSNFIGGKTYVTGTYTTIPADPDSRSYQITASTPVFAWDGSNVSTLKKVNYADYTATTATNKTFVYVNTVAGTPREVAYVLVNNEVITPSTYVEGVVTEIQKQNDKVAYVRMVVGTEEKLYDTFRDDAVKSDLAKVDAGYYVRLGLAHDAKTVAKLHIFDPNNTPNMTLVNMNPNDSERVKVNAGTFNAKPVSGAYRKFEMANKYTVVEKNPNNQDTRRYVAAELADLGQLNANDMVYVHFAEDDHGNPTTGFVDAIVIERANY